MEATSHFDAEEDVDSEEYSIWVAAGSIDVVVSEKEIYLTWVMVFFLFGAEEVGEEQAVLRVVISLLEVEEVEQKELLVVGVLFSLFGLGQVEEGEKLLTDFAGVAEKEACLHQVVKASSND